MDIKYMLSICDQCRKGRWTVTVGGQAEKRQEGLFLGMEGREGLSSDYVKVKPRPELREGGSRAGTREACSSQRGSCHTGVGTEECAVPGQQVAVEHGCWEVRPGRKPGARRLDAHRRLGCNSQAGWEAVGGWGSDVTGAHFKRTI